MKICQGVVRSRPYPLPVYYPIKDALLSKISYVQIDHRRVSKATQCIVLFHRALGGSTLFGRVSKNGMLYIRDYILFLGSSLGFKKLSLVSCEAGSCIPKNTRVNPVFGGHYLMGQIIVLTLEERPSKIGGISTGLLWTHIFSSKPCTYASI